MCASGWDCVEVSKRVGMASYARGFILTSCVHLRYVLIRIQTVAFGTEEQVGIKFK